MPEWFEDWFDTKYYHILYEHRDDNEAQSFIKKMLCELSLPKEARILDLACGQGRHSRFLRSLDYTVVGVDLSAKSIACAKSHEDKNLSFVCGDMRKMLDIGKFNLVCNLFTSFGYFENLTDNLSVLNSIHEYLKKDGILVIDFLNAQKIKENLVPTETVIRGGITFQIERKIEIGFIVKTIAFTNDSKHFNYQEKVQLLTLSDFENLFATSGFKIINVFGDYNLGKFAPKISDRLVLIAQKI